MTIRIVQTLVLCLEILGLTAAAKGEECSRANWETYQAGSLEVEMRTCQRENNLETSGYISFVEVRNPYSAEILVTIVVVDDRGKTSTWADWPVRPGGTTGKSIDAQSPTWRIGAKMKR